MKLVIGFWLFFAALAHSAALDFESVIQQVHAPTDALSVTAEFKFTNNSDKPVSIANSDSGCTCVKVETAGGKLRYDPGESGVLRATYTMGNFSGTVDKVIALWINNDPPEKPSINLTVRVHVPVLIAVEPKTVKWAVGGESKPQTIQIRMAEGETIHVTGLKSSSEAFTCELKTIEAGRKYDITVTPRKLDSPSLAVIRIETDCKNPKQQVQQAFAVASKSPQGAAKP